MFAYAAVAAIFAFGISFYFERKITTKLAGKFSKFLLFMASISFALGLMEFLNEMITMPAMGLSSNGAKAWSALFIKSIFIPSFLAATIFIIEKAIFGKKNIPEEQILKKNSEDKIESIDQEYWAKAYEEIDGNRDIGTWARVYAAANGNESVAKAQYLNIRAAYLQKIQIEQDKRGDLDCRTLDSNKNKKGSSSNIQQYTELKYTQERIGEVLVYALENGAYAFKAHGFIYFFQDKIKLTNAIKAFDYFKQSMEVYDENLNKAK